MTSTMAAPPAREAMKVPITVLAGYLGAGKTTLLNRILHEPTTRRYAVIVNEFGEVDIDGDLVTGTDEEIIKMSNGCLCCDIRGDLLDTVSRLLERSHGLDGILIETSGLADPAPVLQTFFLNEDITDRVALDAVVTVVDAFHVADTLRSSDEVIHQIVFADVIILNKVDLLSDESLRDIEAQIRVINSRSTILRATKCDVPIASILDRRAFSLDCVLERDPDFLTIHESYHHEHDHGLRSVSLVSSQPLDPDKFLAWMNFLMRAKGKDLLRSKGLVAFVDEPRRFVFHGVQSILDGDLQREWQPDEERASRLVFIGRDLDPIELRSGFDACLA
jgi:G3E family GTPase